MQVTYIQVAGPIHAQAAEVSDYRSQLQVY